MPVVFQPDWPLSAFPMYKEGVLPEWVEGWEFLVEGRPILNSVENKRASILASLNPIVDKSSPEFLSQIFTWQVLSSKDLDQFQVSRFVCKNDGDQICQRVEANESSVD